jgi:hypothetical protein
MAVISTQAFTFRLVANGVQLDLFDDEDIQLSNNVTGLFDLGVLPSDFTRQITLPGTKVNNAFFEHIYDISIDEPFLFATNVKVPAYFDFDSVYLSQGYLQLNKVNVIANKFIESYEVTIYGTLSSFGRDINRNFLTDLQSLSKYNHTASYDAITSSWNGELFNGDIVYPLADYGSAYSFQAGDNQTFGINDVDGALSVQNFKPAIRVKAVLDSIFEDAGYTYSSSFIDGGALDDIYMICNYGLKYPQFLGVNLETYGKISVGAISGSGMTDILLPSGSWVTLPWYNELQDPGGFYNDGAYRVDKRTNLSGILNINVNVSCSVNNMPGTLSANGTWQLRMLETGSSVPQQVIALQSFIFYFDELQQSRSGGINQTIQLEQQWKMYDIPTGSYYFQIRQSPNFPSPTELPVVTLDPEGTTKSFLQVTDVNQAADGRIMNIPNNMPFGTTGIKQIDFIVGLQRKYNLVIYPNKTKVNEFIIEPFNQWYDKGQRWDFNKYINLDNSIEVIPANNLAVNELDFGDTLDQDYISQQFSKEVNREYGKTYYIDTENFFSQGKFEVKTTFASSPLIKISGTGLSGSFAGSVSFASAGFFAPSTSPNIRVVCESFLEYVEIFSTTGTIDIGSTLYFDSDATLPLTGYRTLKDGCDLYSIDPSTGTVTSYIGQCADFGHTCN